MMIVVFIMMLVINFGFIGFLFSECLSKMNIPFNKQTLVDSNQQSNTMSPDQTLIVGSNVPDISISRTKSVAQFLDDPLLDRNYVLSLERRTNCNLENTSNCFGTEKSLMISFWSQKSSQRWLVLNLLSVFPEKYFDYIVMVHDNSTWSHHPAYGKIIWIHVQGQLRLWYIKRFISPHTLRAYRYVWVVDDDTRFYFNPRVYECVADKYNISLSAPARGEGIIIHKITKLSPRYTSRVGRWTDHIEIGPIFIAKSSVWICLWKFLSEKVGLGYGLDGIWCRVLSERCLRQSSITKTCAVLDAFVAHHDAKTINTARVGMAERPAYKEYYKNYSSKKLVFGAVAPNSLELDLCTSKLSKDES
jgi:hypothetical protein